MASAAGKRRTKVKDELFLYGITPESSEAKLVDHFLQVQDQKLRAKPPQVQLLLEL